MRGGPAPSLLGTRTLTFLGYLYGAVTDFTCCCSSLVSCSGSRDRNCGARTTKAFTTCSEDEGKREGVRAHCHLLGYGRASVRISSTATDLMSSPLYLQVFVAKKWEKLGVIMAKSPILSQMAYWVDS